MELQSTRRGGQSSIRAFHNCCSPAYSSVLRATGALSNQHSVRGRPWQSSRRSSAWKLQKALPLMTVIRLIFTDKTQEKARFGSRSRLGFPRASRGTRRSYLDERIALCGFDQSHKHWLGFL